ncbi:MAG: exonuclease SbcCD subunit D [Promethearchaeota archaeon]
MAQIYHLADLHIGVRTFQRLNAQGQNERLLDYFRALNTVFDDAIKDRVDAVLISGDVFHYISVSATIEVMFRDALKKLVEADIPVIMCGGNHDTPKSVHLNSPIDVFDGYGNGLVKATSRSSFHTIKARDGTNIALYLRGWRHPIRFSKTITSMDDVLLNYRQRLRSDFQKFVSMNLEAEKHILLSHLQLDGALGGIEQYIALSSSSLTILPDSFPEKFDYVALGHIHKQQISEVDPRLVYPGGIELIDFGEKDEKKGYAIVDLSSKEPQVEFRSVPVRPMVQVNVSTIGVVDPTQKVLDDLKLQDLKDLIVRLRIEATQHQKDHIDLPKIHNYFATKSEVFWHDIKLDWQEQERSFVTSLDEEINLLALTKEYIENMENIDKRKKDRLIELALDTLSEIETEDIAKVDK